MGGLLPSVCLDDTKTHQTHTFSDVFPRQFLSGTLCLEPSEGTQFLQIHRLVVDLPRYKYLIGSS